MLSPTKTKQNEIGVKYQNKGILTTLSLFDLKQAANVDVQKMANGIEYKMVKMSLRVLN